MQNDSVRKEAVRKHALEFLKGNHTMVVSTVSPSGEPHAATMYYIADDDFNIYFMTASKSRKAVNLRANDHIAFVVGTGPEVVTIQGSGTAMPLDEHEALVFYGLFERIAPESSPRQWPLLRLAKEGDGFSTFRITPASMVLLTVDKEKYPDIAHDEFHIVI
ncbi:pyridoxamine 5'-phosphate oxidase family protein [Candidatus Kaiserbacteria bacterium]|nr:pyridoxamine 5'-phosphate oxidase family protein [Candidatus Kaiserbacteria bacterium]